VHGRISRRRRLGPAVYTLLPRTSIIQVPASFACTDDRSVNDRAADDAREINERSLMQTSTAGEMAACSVHTSLQWHRVSTYSHSPVETPSPPPPLDETRAAPGCNTGHSQQLDRNSNYRNKVAQSTLWEQAASPPLMADQLIAAQSFNRI